MTSTATLVFKVATERDELDQVHRLNHRTFVEEIPQHSAPGGGVLVDRFHPENTYLVCKRGDRVVGMVAIRDRRPFSLDSKVRDLDRYLPPEYSYCEIRLLAVEREARNGVIFRGLMTEVAEFCLDRGFNAAVISATVRQLKLYEHIGFVPFGPRTGTAEAPFQPMYLTVDAFRSHCTGSLTGRATTRAPTLSFLPGPVDLHASVRQAYGSPLISHRDAAFIAEFHRTKALLCQLTKAPHVEILLGSGTLANDAVALQLAALGEPGVVLANGEFGERLIDHARRAGLEFAAECLEWGAPFDALALDRALDRHPAARWCWMVHLETSTGVLNDLPHAAAACSARHLKLCSDCVSAIGGVPLDLSRVHLATGVSGKALASVAGLSLVFHQGRPARTERAPRYLDLSLYAGADGVPFTTTSGLCRALHVAVSRTLQRADFAERRALTIWLRDELRALGLNPLGSDRASAPGIVTLVFDADESAESLGDALARAGFAVSYRSEYLRERNWLQIALMGECSREKVEILLRALRQLCASAASADSPS